MARIIGIAGSLRKGSFNAALLRAAAALAPAGMEVEVASIAGIYFSAICLYRSFGMAVATHASYDIMAMISGALA